MDEDRAFDLIEASRVAVLATIRPDGAPRMVPVVYGVTDDRHIVTSVDQKPKSTRRLKRLEDIGRDPRVTLLWQHYCEEWAELWWVRIDGEARVFEQPSAAMVDALEPRYHQYHVVPPRGPWIDITPLRIVGWP